MSTSTASVLARAGGGGSSSGGGGGGGSSHSSSGSRSSGGSGGSFGVSDAAVLLVFFAIAIGVGVIQQRRARRKRAVVEGSVQAAAALDARWQPEVLRKRVEEVFMKFQTAWSAMDLAALNPLLTDAYRQRMVLQLAVLAAEHRKNLIERPVVDRVEIIQAIDATGTRGDRFTAEVTAHTHDVLLDTRTNTPLSTDDSTFTEYWTFAREGDNWELDQIRQSTEEASLLESAIAEFATRNGFFYDPDFGWLMLPNEGVLFRQSNFKTSDVNNHVIGEYRGFVVEFYTFIPNRDRSRGNYVVAQAILPKAYDDILVRRRRMLRFAPRGMHEVTTESTEFNRAFSVYAHDMDRVNSLELLTPDFILTLADLPYEVNIEVVGQVIYFYTQDRRASYDQLLDIIRRAFDAMKK